jgi:osmotically-inducible protein OsmY
MRCASLGVLLSLIFLSGCSNSQQRQANEDAHTAAEKLRTEAQQLSRDAQAGARKLKRDIKQANIERDTTPAAEKLRSGEHELRKEAGAAAVQLDHAALVARVKAKLAADAGLTTAGNVSVDANGGVITLRGTVSSEAQKQEAEQAASQAGGVSKVVNEIQVRP